MQFKVKGAYVEKHVLLIQSYASGNPQFFHPGIKCVGVYIEDLRRPAGAGDFASGFFQYAQDVAFFILSYCLRNCADGSAKRIVPQIRKLVDLPLTCLLYTSPSPRDS